MPHKLPNLSFFDNHSGTVVRSPACRLRLDVNTYRVARRRVDTVLHLTPQQLQHLEDLLCAIERDPALISPLLRRVSFLQGPDNVYHY